MRLQHLIKYFNYFIILCILGIDFSLKIWYNRVSIGEIHDDLIKRSNSTTAVAIPFKEVYLDLRVPRLSLQIRCLRNVGCSYI